MRPRAKGTPSVLIHLLFIAGCLFPPISSNAEERSGELLLGELHCTGCHPAPKELRARIFEKLPPLLGEAGSRMTPGYLRAFLADPPGVKPGTVMPDLLRALDGPARGEAIEDLTHFLSSLRRAAGSPPIEADGYEIERGRRLYHTVGCVACHEPLGPPVADGGGLAAASVDADRSRPGSGDAPAAASPVEAALRRIREQRERSRQSAEGQAIPLGDLARKTTVGELSRFLFDPLAVRPSGRMPAMGLSEGEARAIAMYLLREQIGGGEADLRPIPGLHFAYFEGAFDRAEPEFRSGAQRATGSIDRFSIGPRRRDEEFGFRFTGRIRIPAAGRYTFFTASDDGSRLYIDDRLVVDNDGIHSTTERNGAIELEAGDHSILATFFERNGGEELVVSWEGPGFRKQEIPAAALSHLGLAMRPLGGEEFAIDPERMARGRGLFASLGCASCHALGGDREPVIPGITAPALLDLDPEAAGSCLDPAPRAGLPDYRLDSARRRALQLALAGREVLSRPLDSGERLRRALDVLGCLACHQREGAGGPSIDRSDYFTMTIEADLGDEGRFPPRLDGVGAKLRPEWLAEVLAGRGSARPYLATRMPSFGAENVGWLASAFIEADRAEADRAGAGGAGAGSAEPRAARGELVDPGRVLTGTQGYSCITCHTYGKYPSLGIPALDLARMTARLQEDWFRRYLLDPQALRPGTRMPQFWPEGQGANRDVLGGDPGLQIEALWSYLSKGESVLIPHGLKRIGMELVPDGEPIVYRGFIDGAGTRAIAVGFPEEVHLAFDANDLRIALIWRGSFLDVSRHWSSRGAGWEPPLGRDVLRLTPGAPLAVLPDAASPWPAASGRAAGFRFRGYRLDAERRPAFIWEFLGIAVEDIPAPVPIDGGFGLRRTLEFRSSRAVSGLWFRPAAGKRIEDIGGGAYRVDGVLTLRFSGEPAARPAIRKGGGGEELIVPIEFSGHEARIALELIW